MVLPMARRIIIALIILAIAGFVFGWLISELAADEAVTKALSEWTERFRERAE